MEDSTGTQNGAPQTPEELARAVEALNGAGTVAPGSGAEAPGGPHDVPSIRGLPEDAVHRAAEHLCDPEEMRRTGVDAGRRLHAVEPEKLFEPDGDVAKLYEALGGIRKGAVLLPGERDAVELLKEGRTAHIQMAVEEARGRADREHAARLLEEQRPEHEQARDDAELKVGLAATELEAAEEVLDEALEAAGKEEVERRGEDKAGKETERQPGAPEDKRSVWERVPIGRKAMLIVAPCEIAATTLLLHDAISTKVQVDSDFAAYAVSAAVSTAFLSLGLVAGYGAAAMRLPARLAGLVVVALASWLLARSGVEMNLLRAHEEGGVALLTYATLAAVLIAGVTSYGAVRYKAYQSRPDAPDEQAVLKEIGVRLPLGNPIAVPLRKRDRAAERLAEKRQALAEREGTLGRLDATIAALRSSSEETAMRVLAAQKAGVKAEVALGGVEKETNTRVAQEDAHTDAAKAAARLGHAMVRAEERPDEGETLDPIPARANTRAPAPSRKSPWRRRLALAVLAGGVVPGLLLPSAPVALGGALVAALLWPFARRRHAAVAAAGQDEKTPSIVPTADEDHPLWRWQPSYMVAKYRGDGPNSTERV